MGKNNKKGPKPNVFKVAGAKSLKKTKTKAVNLGLKNIKQKVVDLDKQFIETNKKSNKDNNSSKPNVKMPSKKKEKNITKEEVANTVQKIDKMDI